MIILDDNEQQPKIDYPPSLHVRTNRPSTPSPSLPDYDASQEHFKAKIEEKRPLSKRMKYTLWGLGIYTGLSLVVGLILVLVSLCQSHDTASHPHHCLQVYQPWRYGSAVSYWPLQSLYQNASCDSTASLFNIATSPMSFKNISRCNDWQSQDVFDGSRYNA